MRTDAPGKLVISGAYAVLRGAPAIVSAVGRRVLCDTKKPADYLAPEVESGLRLLGTNREHPYYDPSKLRSSTDKLGVGSSAAICVACLGAILAEDRPELDRETLRDTLYPIAREAHRVAQGGGSGVDIAAACFGGTLVATPEATDRDTAPRLRAVELPSDLILEVWASRETASTATFVKRVLSLEAEDPREFLQLFDRQARASEQAVRALEIKNGTGFIESLIEQRRTLRLLGLRVGLPIVPDTIDDLGETLGSEDALLPSGAGGGDVNLYVGRAPSSDSFRERAIERGLFRVPLSFGAEGFRILPEA